MELEFEDNFLVMPDDTNANSPMIFGGAFFSKMDLCAAKAVRRLLYSSENCSASVTHKFEGSFHRPYQSEKRTRKATFIAICRSWLKVVTCLLILRSDSVNTMLWSPLKNISNKSNL